MQRTASLRLTSDSTPARFHVVAPRDGDRYRVPPGVDPRYASIGLRAAGADGTVRWFVDGRQARGARFLLVPGAHTIVARSARGDSSVVTVRVE
jgi:membrane carboxypeptidase/penicillin-binding protein PbpC